LFFHMSYSEYLMSLFTPDLSIIIPVLNEAATLHDLFATLERQRGLALEIIFSVGSSCDGSAALIAQYSACTKHEIIVVPSVTGRAVQMNCGADVATGDLLFFLHADCSWQEPYLLRDAVTCFNQEINHRQPAQVAGHFCLNFRHYGSKNRFYRYLGEKATLNRRGTIYGDQGMLLKRNLWQDVGRFREDVSALEDVFFADAVAAKAAWILLPQLITTSTRRYLSDGIGPRIIINALLLIVGGAGLQNFSPTYTSEQSVVDKDGSQSVCLLLRYIKRCLHRSSMRQSCAFWYTCAQVIIGYSWFPCYACGWLLPFIDSKRRSAMLLCHERYVLPLLVKPLCCGVLALSSWLAFYLVYLCVIYPGPCYARAENP